MRSTRAILSVRYTAASPAVGRAVGGFLRYVHYRDHQQQGELGQGAAGLIRYVAYRDQASPQGRLFTRDATAGDRERKDLTRFVRRSLEGGAKSNARAVYRFVLSPEDARGLDLRLLARTTMSRLEQDLGRDNLPLWIAAEHRNTAHPHVHIVMAARLEVAPGVFRGVQVTRQRLARMKSAMSREIERERGARAPARTLEDCLLEICRRPAGDRRRGLRERLDSTHSRERLAVHDPVRRRRSGQHVWPVAAPGAIQRLFARMARAHQRQLEEQVELAEQRSRQRRRQAQEEREREDYR